MYYNIKEILHIITTHNTHADGINKEEQLSQAETNQLTCDIPAVCSEYVVNKILRFDWTANYRTFLCICVCSGNVVLTILAVLFCTTLPVTFSFMTVS